MSNSRKDQIETVNTTPAGMDSSTCAILDAMQRQNENFTKEIHLLTRRLEETQRAADRESKKRTAEIELL